MPRPLLPGLLLLVALMLCGGMAQAQRTRVHGVVADARTGDPLAWANVGFPGAAEATRTDSLGRFLLLADGRRDSLQVTMTGYRTLRLALAAGGEADLFLELEPDTELLDEVRVRPGENPAFAILRQVVARKPVNAPAAAAYRMELYHRVRFDLNHFTDRIKRNILLRPFDFLWEGIDTTAEGVRYLPMLLTERHERRYHRPVPSTMRTVLLGSRTAKFFRARRIMEFVQDMYVEPDIYQDHVLILDRGFPSPINDHFQRAYRYLLHDSLVPCSGYVCHRISFRPRVEADAAFTGEMLIDTASFAVVRVDLAFSIAANVNFVRHYRIRQYHAPAPGGPWFMRRSELLADFTVIENDADLTGFYGRKLSVVRDLAVGQPPDEAFLREATPDPDLDSAYHRDDGYWQAVRPEPLGVEEQQVVRMVDRMNADPRWKRREALLHLLAEGWLPLGAIDVGNVFTFASHNRVEGWRGKFGLRTTERLARGWGAAGHLAYGVDDARFKGAASVWWRPRDARRRRPWGGGLDLWDDLMQPGRSPGLLPLDHALTSLVRLSGADPRWYRRLLEGHVEHRGLLGTAARVAFFHERLADADGSWPLLRAGDTLAWPTVALSGVRLSLRWSPDAPGGTAVFDQERKGLFAPQRPTVALEATFGADGLWDGQVDMARVKLRFEHRQRAGRWGYLDLLAEGGALAGAVPYPLLFHPHANPLLFNEARSFNLMNQMEFTADRYALVHVEHHLEGFLLNRVPLLGRIKLREFVFARAFVGALRAENRHGSVPLPDGLTAPDGPYVEVGFGLENILKVARVDLVWRLTQLDRPDALPFVVKPSFHFKF
ncbi:MAG: carboxypeptidase-like regulatory domain-containing protein [Flavobacteriales bacterium]|nr:hypothetical protein [Flavobacteriales bacterium]MCC6577120.1 carboxypeptidase-like regulatory domain-containing protein [Flavobacteriales bacterium]NUQ16690.1 carboxypeptidase-like regulatory domain-containing protein [Flavobacteriales bacterium]